VVAVTEGRIWGWTEARTIACLLGSGGGVALALMRSAHAPVPAIQTGLWRSRTYAAANLVSMLFGAALFAWLLAGVLFLTQVWHYSELAAGFAVTPGALAAASAGIAMGRLSRKPSPRALTCTGASMIAATGFALAMWIPSSPHFLSVWLPAGLIAGAGMGAVSVGVSTAAALSVKPQSYAAATGLNIAARQVGGAVGVAVLAVLLDERAHAAEIASFRRVYIFAATACAGAALLALRLRVSSDDPHRRVNRRLQIAEGRELGWVSADISHRLDEPVALIGGDVVVADGIGEHVPPDPGERAGGDPGRVCASVALEVGGRDPFLQRPSQL